ncbi:MAG: carbohydrate ABC transporter permease [Bacilli bacterium]|nr:carbohydrate ABC transporter permease [Bacilli bacterium]
MNKSKVFSKTIIYIILIIWAIGCIYPFYWILINSFKDKSSILSNSFSLPFGSFTFDNYYDALFGKYNILQAYLNSFIISGSVVVIVIVISTFSSYVLARYDFKGKKLVYALVIACMMFPIFSTIFPLFKMLVGFGLNGKRLGVILPQVAGNLGFATILLTGFIQNIPVEVEESAYIDGANIFQVMFHITIPMAKSAYSSAAIFVFLWSYNDLFLQMLILTDKKMMPVSALLREISSKEGGTNQGLMVASVALIAIPVIIVYFFLQKNIIKGLTAGAIKG